MKFLACWKRQLCYILCSFQFGENEHKYVYVAKRNLIESAERILELKPNTILTAIHKEPQQTNRKAGL